MEPNSQNIVYNPYIIFLIHSALIEWQCRYAVKTEESINQICKICDIYMGRFLSIGDAAFIDSVNTEINARSWVIILHLNIVLNQDWSEDGIEIVAVLIPTIMYVPICMILCVCI